MDGAKDLKPGKKRVKSSLPANPEPGVPLNKHQLEYRLAALRRVKMNKRWMSYPWNAEIDQEIRALEDQISKAGNE